jgi:hypothetical protein
MHLLYLDDSGDDGRSNASTTHFVLGGLACRDWDWHRLTGEVESIMSNRLGAAGARTELHGYEILSGKSVFRKMSTTDREALVTEVLTEVGRKESQLSLFFVIVHKDSLPVTRNVRTIATLQLCQRFNSYLTRVGAFKKKTQEHGMLICDENAARSQVQSLMAVIHSGGLPRQMRDNLVETAFFLESHRSRVLQVADLLCHVVFRFVTVADDRFFHLVERKVDRDTERKWGRDRVIHYGFRYLAEDASDGLSGVLPFKHLSTTPNGLPRGSFLKASQLEKELVSHGL